MNELNPITRKEMFLAAAAGQDIELPTPITRKEMFLAKIAAGAGAGGSTGGGTAIKYRRYTVEYSPSDLTLKDDVIYAFAASDEKQTEVLALFSKLSTLTSVSMTVHVTVPGIGEIMRLPVLFETKNEAVGTNGSLQALTLEYFDSDGSDFTSETGGFSIYKNGFSVVPLSYVQPIVAFGVVFDIDVLYL